MPNLDLYKSRPSALDYAMQYRQNASALRQADMQNAAAQYQMKNLEQEAYNKKALNDAYQSAVDPTTGALNQDALRRSLASGGMGSQIPALEKSWNDQAKVKAETANLTTKNKLDEGKVVDEALSRSRAMLERIDMNAPTAKQAVAQWLTAQYQDPVLGAKLKEAGMNLQTDLQQLQNAPDDQFRQFGMQLQMGAKNSAEMNKKQLTSTDTGGSIAQQTFNPVTGQLEQVNRLGKSLEPGKAQQLAMQQESNNLAREKFNYNQYQDSPEMQRQSAYNRAMSTERGKRDIETLENYGGAVGRLESIKSLAESLVGKRPVIGPKGEILEKGKESGVGIGVGMLGEPISYVATKLGGFEASNFKMNHDRLLNLLTLENLGLMKGVISDKDLAVLASAASQLNVNQTKDAYIKTVGEIMDVYKRNKTQLESKFKAAEGRVGKDVQKKAYTEQDFNDYMNEDL